ncbi:hypothetical protein PSEUDO9AG_10335 [Pseudomonas sp. 9Ag]|nr:hypothetical protein PSEUDO9AG_10335 [Pseudomonas sp. 9Ag]
MVRDASTRHLAPGFQTTNHDSAGDGLLRLPTLVVTHSPLGCVTCSQGLFSHSPGAAVREACGSL